MKIENLCTCNGGPIDGIQITGFKNKDHQREWLRKIQELFKDEV